MFGIRGFLGIAATAVTAFALGIDTPQAATSKWQPPRTEHGHPDLQGLWDTGTKTPFQRPATLGEKRSSLEGILRGARQQELEAKQQPQVTAQ